MDDEAARALELEIASPAARGPSTIGATPRLEVASRVSILRTSALVVAGSGALYATAGGLAAAALVGGGPVAVMAAALATSLAACGVALRRWNPAPNERLGRLEVTRLGVFVDGDRVGPLAGARAEVRPQRGDAPVVRVRTTRRSFEVRVEDDTAAARLVAAIEGSPVASSVIAQRLRLASPVFSNAPQLARFGLYAVLLTVAFPLVGLTFHVNPGFATLLMTLAFAAATGLVILLLSDTVVDVTKEGLRVRWLRGGRLLRFGEIASVDVRDEAVDLRGRTQRRVLVIGLHHGETLRFPCDGADPATLAEVMRAARRGAAGRVAPPAERLVSSAGRRVREWVQAVRTVAGGGTHRSAPVSDDALWGVVEDASAPADARAGAAVALLASSGDDARPRLRVAAEGAAPAVRVAIEAAVDATSEAELEEALFGVTNHEPALLRATND